MIPATGGEIYDYVQIIEPTAPLLEGSIIKDAANFLTDHKADMVVSVCPTGAPNGIVGEIPDSLSLRGFVPKELRRKNRQQVKTRYQLNGMIYVGKWDIFYCNKDWWDTNIKAFIMDKDAHVDINDPTDFQLAEWILAKRNGLSVMGSVGGG
jgi:CMP-N-acetylneuraminic acid synthetase